VYRLDFGATELVSSWDAQVPRGTWVRTQLRATMQNGQKTRWLVVNDPAGPSDNTVRHVFSRRQFENVWLRTCWERPDGSTGYGSGGVAYIIWPRGMRLPPNLDPLSPPGDLSDWRA